MGITQPIQQAHELLLALCAKLPDSDIGRNCGPENSKDANRKSINNRLPFTIVDGFDMLCDVHNMPVRAFEVIGRIFVLCQDIRVDRHFE